MVDMSERARLVQKLAQHEALRFDHPFVGTEHILLGLRREGGPASQALAQLGLNVQMLRKRVEMMADPGGPMLELPGPWTLRATKTLRYAHGASEGLSSPDLAPEYVLLGLLRDPECLGCQILSSLGIDIDGVARNVAADVHKHMIGSDPLT